MRARIGFRRLFEVIAPPRRWLLGIAAAAGLLGSSLVVGQTSENVELTRSVIVGGGSSSSERYAVDGAVGQAEADPDAATSERYLIRGGFFTAQTADLPDSIFSDGFED